MGTVKGFGYNRTKQALGTTSKDTFVKEPKLVEGILEAFLESNEEMSEIVRSNPQKYGNMDPNQIRLQGVTVGCGGAQSYAVVKLA